MRGYASERNEALLFFILPSSIISTWAQDTTQIKRLEYIRADNLLNGDLPQGERFIIFGSVAENIAKVVVYLKRHSRNAALPDSADFENKSTIKRAWKRSPSDTSAQNLFELQIPPLIKNSDYAIMFVNTSKLDATQLAALEKSLKENGHLAKAIHSFLDTTFSPKSKIHRNSQLMAPDSLKTGFTFGSFLSLVKTHVLDSLGNVDKIFSDQLTIGLNGLEPVEPGKTTNFFRYLNWVVTALADSAILDTFGNSLFTGATTQKLTNLSLITLPAIIDGKSKIQTLRQEIKNAYGMMSTLDSSSLISLATAGTINAVKEIYERKALIARGSAPVLSFANRLPFYVSADVGVSFIPTLDESTPYIGINFYFASVDKDTPLWMYGSFIDTFWQRFSMMVVTAFVENTNEGKRIERSVEVAFNQ